MSYLVGMPGEIVINDIGSDNLAFYEKKTII